MIHFDSSFLVDLLRERRRRQQGPALRLLWSLSGTEGAKVSVHAVCELYVGIELAADPDAERERVERVLATVSIALPDDGFAPTYARLLAALKASGRTVATMDLLIATAAVCDGAPLVTRNPRHFLPVPGLKVVTY